MQKITLDYVYNAVSSAGVRLIEYHDYSKLEESAYNGCDLCRLLRQEYIHSVSETIPTPGAKIYVQPSLKSSVRLCYENTRSRGSVPIFLGPTDGPYLSDIRRKSRTDDVIGGG